MRVTAGRAPGARGWQASRAGPGPGPGEDQARDPARAAGPGPAPPAAGRGPALALGLGLGLLALGPGLRRGFLLSYDMIFVPRQPFTAAMYGLAGGPPRAVPSDAVVAAAARLMPADIVQKVLLLAVFVLACSGAVALLEREHWLARLAAGAFYAWNPFVAERLIIGQWALLLGYAGLPWALRAVLAHQVVSWRGAGRLSLALLPACIGGFAAMSISALAILPAAALAGPRAPAPPVPVPGAASRSGGAALRVLTVLAVLAGLSLPWLIPSLLHPVYAAPAGVAAFAARADTPFGAPGSLLMLGGIWNAQTVPAAYGGAWSVLWLALVLVAVAGYLACGGPPGRRRPAARPAAGRSGPPAAAGPGWGPRPWRGWWSRASGPASRDGSCCGPRAGSGPGSPCSATASSSWPRWPWPRRPASASPWRGRCSPARLMRAGPRGPGPRRGGPGWRLGRAGLRRAGAAPGRAAGPGWPGAGPAGPARARRAAARAGVGSGRAAAPGLVPGRVAGRGARDRSEPGPGQRAAAALGGVPAARLERRADPAGPLAAAAAPAGDLG